MQFDVTVTIPVVGPHTETRLVVADDFDAAYEWTKDALADREFFLEAGQHDVTVFEILTIEFAGYEDAEEEYDDDDES